MKGAKVAKNIALGALEPVETIRDQVARPISQEMLSQLFGKGEGSFLSSRPKTVGHEDLQRARQEQQLNNQQKEDDEQSAKQERAVKEQIVNEYKVFKQKEDQQQNQLHEQVAEMQEEVVKLAKAAGVDTKIHLETTTKKLGILHIKRLTAIIRSLRIKAESAKSGSDLVTQRQNAKASTGMMAWVSGKQMKVHEQGTMQLQG